MVNHLFRFAGNLFSLALLSLLPLMAQAQTADSSKSTLTAQEREAAVKYLEETRVKFLDSIKNLSDEQWKFKPGPDRWSAAEVAEHIAVSEQTLLGLVTERIMKTPAAPEKKEAVKGKDDLIRNSITNRTVKVQAPEMLRPTNRWATREELVKAFNANRDQTIAYVKTTQDDLRSHFFTHPVFKDMDGYQWVLLLAGHSARHTLQIEEVEADPNFPK
ncbi:MAG TPA: DinB family protein, partial [Blastocatellia bacterium]|nr:DinB family protein [Blastocatellia bacterium]